MNDAAAADAVVCVRMFVSLINRPFMGFVIGNAYPMKILNNIDTSRAIDN